MPKHINQAVINSIVEVLNKCVDAAVQKTVAENQVSAKRRDMKGSLESRISIMRGATADREERLGDRRAEFINTTAQVITHSIYEVIEDGIETAIKTSLENGAVTFVDYSIHASVLKAGISSEDIAEILADVTKDITAAVSKLLVDPHVVKAIRKVVKGVTGESDFAVIV